MVAKQHNVLSEASDGTLVTEASTILGPFREWQGNWPAEIETNKPGEEKFSRFRRYRGDYRNGELAGMIYMEDLGGCYGKQLLVVND